MENKFSLKRFLTNHIASDRHTFGENKMDAVECFTARSLSAIPAGWIEELLRHRGKPTPMPMYGYLFAIDEKPVEQIIDDNLAEYDFGNDFDRQSLIEHGWRVICSTGLFALRLDGRVLIGIDGVGYDFFKAHWEPLYDLLGYKWHLDD